MARITLNWNPPSDSSGGSATSYKIYRVNGTETSGSTIVSTGTNIANPNHSGSATAQQEYPDDSAQHNQTYSYTILGNNAAGPSETPATPATATA